MSAVHSFEQFDLREMQYADLPAVLETERAGYQFPWTEGIFRDCLRVGYSCWVLCEGEKVVGYCIISVGVREAHLLNLCIHPDEQGRGLGRYLVWHALDQARLAGAKTMFLEVRPSNETARHLYATVGFVEVGKRRGYYRAEAGREDAVVLALEL